MPEPTPPNGEAVPTHIEFENTGEVAAPLWQAANETGSAEAFLNSLAVKLAEHGGGGGGGDEPAKRTKQIKRSNWLAVLMATLLGPGGAVAVIYATSDRAKENSQEVKHLKDTNGSLLPRLDKTEEDVRYIKVRVSEVKTQMGEVQTQQTSIANGIEELKNENINRLKSELDDARRELRRRGND